jgi:VanZ family protein
LLVKITTLLAILTNKSGLYLANESPSICKATINYLGMALVMLWEEIAIPMNKEPDHERI